MNSTRQDAWTPDEDLLLAETVLRYIGEGKTQLEAFKEVAKKLSRTSAACGFRWNASIRKQYQQDVQMAKEKRKQGESYTLESSLSLKSNGQRFENNTNDIPDLSLDTAISLLEKMKMNYYQEQTSERSEDNEESLKKEVEDLRQQIKRYHEAWEEMGKLWKWIETTNSHRDKISSGK